MPARIVCGIDRSDAARAAALVAAALARSLGSRLEFLHVCHAEPHPEHGVVQAVAVAAEEALGLDEVDVRLDAGPVAERLAAAARDAELLVVGARTKLSVIEALRGTVSDAVARAPERPMVVVPDLASRRVTAGRLAGRTVVCYVQDELDTATAHAASRLAAALRLPMMVLHALARPVTPALAGPAVAPGELAPPEELTASAERLLETVRHEVEAASGVRVLEGSSGAAFAQAAVEEDAAVLAVRAPDRGPLASALVGAVSHYVLRHADRPVLVCPGNGAR